jgi:hypothetical protein
MQIRLYRGAWACALTSVFWLVPFASCLRAQMIAPETRDEARDFLRALVRTDALEQRVAAALEALKAEEYSERIRATRRLLNEPVLPEELIEDAMREGSVDLRLRLKQIEEYHDAGRLEHVLASTLQLISDRAWKGFAADLVVALEGRPEEGGGLWKASMEAMETTALPDDAPQLRRALGSGTALVRGVGLAGLVAVNDGAFKEEIAALATDPNRLNVLQVADFLRARRDRRCLAAYVSLLDADDFSVRMKAAQSLRALTGKTFGYEAGARGAKRWVALLSWRSWLDGNGAAAELDFAEVAAKEIVLFDGVSLAGWREVGGDVEAGWGVEDGALVCRGLHNAGTSLRTEAGYADYRLSLEYRLPFGRGDSGLGLFVGPDEVATPSSLEVQVLSGKTGDLYRIGSFKAKDADGRAIQFQKAREGEPVEAAGDWNRIECVVTGGSVEIRLNGTVVNRATECPTESLHINLRNEGDRVEYRNLVLTPLEP